MVSTTVLALLHSATHGRFPKTMSGVVDSLAMVFFGSRHTQIAKPKIGMGVSQIITALN